MIFIHERAWPATDSKGRDGSGIAVALQERGIAVAVLSFDANGRPLEAVSRAIVRAIRELAQHARKLGFRPRPVLAGEGVEAALVTSLALDERHGLGPERVDGVIGLGGIYEEIDARCIRENAPPILLLSAHDESSPSPRSSRAFARRLERAGARNVRSYHAAQRDPSTLGNFAGERNDVRDLVTAFMTAKAVPGGPEGSWALTDTWGPHSPQSTEGFWLDPRLVVRRAMGGRMRDDIRTVFGAMNAELEPWALATYDAIDLLEYLHAHPEFGTGDWVEITNARGEKLVVSRQELERSRPVIVVGIDDERNLFRLFATYNVYLTYSWLPETEPRPLLLRSIGAFVFTPEEARSSELNRTLLPVTGANFALTPSSFKVLARDPLENARKSPLLVERALTSDRGCLQCHSFHGEGARAHHVRAANGTLSEGFALPLEEYPEGVLQRFLFDQKEVARRFGVGPLELDKATAALLFAEIRRPSTKRNHPD